jgi:hypothetical protein
MADADADGAASAHVQVHFGAAKMRPDMTEWE